jgi:uncharacterized protein
MSTELPDWMLRLELSRTLRGLVPRNRYPGPRSAGTAILFVLMPGQQSARHTVQLSFFHRGGPLLLDIGREQSTATTHVLGADICDADHPQLVVPPGYRQRARPRGDEPALVSCVVIPGFDVADFNLAPA